MRASADLEQVRPDYTSMESHRTIERSGDRVSSGLRFAWILSKMYFSVAS